MRRSILDWVSGTMSDATCAIILTHNIDFLFLQSILQPRLRKIGHPKLTVFADAECAVGSYQQQEQFLSGLGRDYRVVPVDMGVGRRFHPKALLLAGPTKATLAVGSGNLTHGGWSANQEIWATFETDQGDAAYIAGFRNYLETVQTLTGNDGLVGQEISDAFDPNVNVWVSELPEPQGLIGAPNDQSILERLIELIGDDIQAATICAPYFDPDGAALTEIAKRINVPIRTLVQKGRVGLSSDAAAGLPDNVDMVSIDTDPPRFIHAKLYAFDRGAVTSLVSGSANISRAALLSTEAWGNAELVALQEVGNEQTDEIFAELIVQDEPPVFPAAPPSDEWEIPTTPVRILKVRFYEGLLSIKFKVDGIPIALSLLTDDGNRKDLSEWSDDGQVSVSCPRCPRSVRLGCKFDDGREELSAPLWVNDEASLGKPVPERRLTAKLIESMEAGSLSAGGMVEILLLLNQHLRYPVSQAQRTNQNTTVQDTTGGRSYGVDEVFAEGFGKPSADISNRPSGGFSQSTFLATFAAYFSLSSPETEPPPEQGSGNGQEPDTPEPEDEATIEAREAERRKRRQDRIEEGVRLRKKLLSAFDAVAQAMKSDEFIDGRPPERLGADITATALLIRKYLIDEIISEDDYAKVTEDLWLILFFGSKNEPSVLDRLDAMGAEDGQENTVQAIASPKLTAALTIWCSHNWDSNEPFAVKFRFAAMLLAARFPWLVSNDQPDDIHAELRRLSRAMQMGAGFESLNAAWVDWLRAGQAFSEFERAAHQWTARELAQMISVKEVKAGELLWQASELCVSDMIYQRQPSTKAIVMPLRGGADKMIVGNWLVPVGELINQGQAFDMHDGARLHLQKIIAEIDDLQSRDSD
jgi:hypothetical protein